MNLISASNRQQTLLRKLNQKKYRYKEQLFLLEGTRAVQQVIENKSVSVQALFFDESQQYWKQKEWEQVVEKYNAATLSRELFVEVADTDTPQGVLAVCEIPDEISVPDLASQKGIVIALDALQDPGNLGTVIRTASWFSAAGIISGKGTVDLFHPKVVRSTAGATGVIPHLNGDLSEVFPVLEAQDWSVFLLDASADSMPLHEISSIEKAVVVVGNEAHGVDTGLRTESRKKVRIDSPSKRPQVESLNAAIATSIALYDLSGKLA